MKESSLITTVFKSNSKCNLFFRAKKELPQHCIYPPLKCTLRHDLVHPLRTGLSQNSTFPIFLFITFWFFLDTVGRLPYRMVDLLYLM